MIALKETDQDQYDRIIEVLFVNNKHMVNKDYEFTVEKFLRLKQAFKNSKQVVDMNDITGNTGMVTRIDYYINCFVLADRFIYLGDYGVVLFSIPDSTIVQSLSDPDEYTFFRLLSEMFTKDHQIHALKLYKSKIDV